MFPALFVGCACCRFVGCACCRFVGCACCRFVGCACCRFVGCNTPQVTWFIAGGVKLWEVGR